MQKILVISYFFPPCGLTASQRVESWATYFHSTGLYPIVITRNWDHPVRGQEDILKPGGKKVLHQEHDHYEVYYLPHKGSLRDKLYYRYGKTPLRWLTKPLTMAELVGQNYYAAWAPFGYLAMQARRLLREDPSISHVLISGNPFILFRYGHELKKEFPHIRWIADYRDDWTTSEINNHSGWLRNRIHRMEQRSEKKWLSNAAFITSVSPHYTAKISAFTGRPGHTIYNGFEPLPAAEIKKPEAFSIVFNGTLYATQPVEDFCAALRTVMQQHPEVPVKLRFPGLAFDPVQEQRVRACLQGWGPHTEITGRIPRADVLKMQQEAQVLLLLSHPGVKGITSSKFFEYLSLRKPVLLYPGDQDILDKIMQETRCGHIANSPEELVNKLGQLFREFSMAGQVSVQPDEAKLEFYTRQKQAEILAQLIQSLPPE